MSSLLQNQKQHLRHQMLELLKEKAAHPDAQASLRARDLFLSRFANLGHDKIVAATLPLAGELDPMPLLEALAAKGYSMALPFMKQKGLPLGFRRYKPGDAMEEKIWGIREPLPSAPEVIPQVLICPLLAFDRHGNRLGRGAGYYDATLRELRNHGKVIAIGYAWAAQEVKSVPVGDQDEKVAAIVTEKELILPSSGHSKS